MRRNAERQPGVDPAGSPPAMLPVESMLDREDRAVEALQPLEIIEVIGKECTGSRKA